jgi:hypothetical protein
MANFESGNSGFTSEVRNSRFAICWSEAFVSTSRIHYLLEMNHPPENVKPTLPSGRAGISQQILYRAGVFSGPVGGNKYPCLTMLMSGAYSQGTQSGRKFSGVRPVTGFL